MVSQEGSFPGRTGEVRSPFRIVRIASFIGGALRRGGAPVPGAALSDNGSGPPGFDCPDQIPDDMAADVASGQMPDVLTPLSHEMTV